MKYYNLAYNIGTHKTIREQLNSPHDLKTALSKAEKDMEKLSVPKDIRTAMQLIMNSSAT